MATKPIQTDLNFGGKSKLIRPQLSEDTLENKAELGFNNTTNRPKIHTGTEEIDLLATGDADEPGLAQSLVDSLETSLKGGVAVDGDTLAKLRALISTLQTSDASQSSQLTAIQTLLASDDTTLDSLQEIVTYIKNEQSLIDSITTSKLSVSVYNAFLTQYASDLSAKLDSATAATDGDYAPAENNNSTGFFAGLLTSGKLKIKAALDKMTAVIKTKADLGSDGKVLTSQLPSGVVDTTGIPAYNQANAFVIGDQVTQLTRLWSAKVNIAANTASSAPPTDPLVQSNAYWTELSGTHIQNTDTQLKRSSTGTALTADTIYDGIVPKVLTSTFAGGALSVNLDSGRVFKITLTGNVTSFTFTGGTAGMIYKVYLIQDGTGSRTLAGVDSKLKTEDDRTILLSTTAGAVDLLQLDYEDSNTVGLYPIYDRK